MVNQPKQLQRAVESFVIHVAPAMRDVVARLPEIDGRRLDQDVATEAFSLVTALIDVDRSHTDDELWGLIFAFGRWLPDQLARAKPDDLRRSDRALAAIATSTGFYDQAAFTRQFRKHMGITPLAYRRQFR